MKATRIHITGVVQGVGFRPFVHGLAQEYSLAGWVRNDSDGVHVHVEGPTQLVDTFVAAIENRAPAAAEIEQVIVTDTEVKEAIDFEILVSEVIAGERTYISPDRATCEACEAELFDTEDRRYRYPFINCTECGPRFTIIDDMPYDRPNTTMRDFTMCAACQAEYDNTVDRRFHAQPNACFVCGPRLYLNYGEHNPRLDSPWAWSPRVEQVPRSREEETARSNSILLEAVEALNEGKIIALKGLGGFQLACDARNEQAVNTLRDRKHRYGKPFAIMVPTLKDATRYCHLTKADAEAMQGPTHPIVLAPRKEEDDTIAEAVAPGLTELGVMLPYTPLHLLLLDEFGGPLVMTSGNISDEPIQTDNAEALEKLSSIADVLLLHDRPIRSRYDDSVVRTIDGELQMIRRARGYAPAPLKLSAWDGDAILAVGPEQKNTFTLASDETAFVSQHIGDLETLETLETFEETERLYERLFHIKPQIIVHDMHPEYLSTKWVDQWREQQDGEPEAFAVQHHHAHIAAVLAEHNHPGPAIGFAFDGTGYGEDGTIWGGEVLVATLEGYERFATLRPWHLPGGAAAIKRPARNALALLYELGLLTEHPGARRLRQRLEEDEEQQTIAMIDQRLNAPLTSSMGRLFDAVSAICGVQDTATYEGSAAVMFEAFCAPLGEIGVPHTHRFTLIEPTQHEAPELGVTSHGRPIPTYAKPRYLIDEELIVRALLDDIQAGVPTPELSRRFHIALINAIGEIATKAARETGCNTVALSGGCFCNRILATHSARVLRDKGLQVLTPRMLPPNDGSISYGQAAVVAAATLTQD